MVVADTLPKFILRNYERWGDEKVAMRKKEFGIWRAYTWEECHNLIKYFCLGLVSLGFGKKDRLAIVGESDPQWYWVEYAVQAAGGVSVGMFTESLPAEFKYVIDDCSARFVVARDQEQIDKILSVHDELPNLQQVIFWENSGLWNYTSPFLKSFDEVVSLGKSYEHLHTQTYEEMVAAGKGDDVAAICYTSGTSGALPKGVMIRHRNVIDTCKAWLFDTDLKELDNYFSVMAPAWIPEQLMGVTTFAVMGLTVNFAEAAETTQADMKEISPHLTGGTPRLWESVASQIQAWISDTNSLSRFLYHLLLPIGYKYSAIQDHDENPSLFWKLQYQLARLTIFRPIKDRMAFAHSKVYVSSGGKLSPDHFRFFRAFGIKLRSSYALTETGGASVWHRVDDVKPQSVGFPMSGVHLRISDGGEILLKGIGTFAGYWKNEQATAKTLRDGWVLTGDVGYTDEGCHLVVLDRLADFVELADGSRFAPALIESRLRFSPYVKEAIVIAGGNKQYVSVIINIDFETVSRWAEANKISYTTFADLSQKSAVSALIQKDIESINKELSPISKIRRFVNLHKEFDADEAELTRTRKIRRGYIESHYQNVIDVLYGDQEEIMIEADVKYRDGRVATIKTPIRVVTINVS